MLKVDRENIFEYTDEEFKQMVETILVEKYTTYTDDQLLDAINDDIERAEWAIEWFYDTMIIEIKKNPTITKAALREIVKTQLIEKFWPSKETRYNTEYYKKFCFHNWLSEDVRGEFEEFTGEDAKMRACPYYKEAKNEFDMHVHDPATE